MVGYNNVTKRREIDKSYWICVSLATSENNDPAKMLFYTL